jgi:hypothetical protein
MNKHWWPARVHVRRNHARNNEHCCPAGCSTTRVCSPSEFATLRHKGAQIKRQQSTVRLHGHSRPAAAG